MRTSRRTFLGGAVLTGAATVALSRYQTVAATTPTPVMRDLGKTGYKTCVVGFGAMNTRDPELIHAAIDTGINYIDTAYVYMNGVNEQIVGRVMETKRDRVFLTTKVNLSASRDLEGQLATSLGRLKTDRVDLVLLHDVQERSVVLDDALMKQFDSMRKKGMTRFVGVSTHSNQAAMLDAAVDSRFWEAVLVGYNYMTPPEVKSGIATARKAGLGIIAMKNLQVSAWPPGPLADIRSDAEKSSMTDAQAKIRWVLNDPNVDVTVPGMTSFEHLAEDVAVMGMKLTSNDHRRLRRLAVASRGSYCSGVAGCTSCGGICPKGVDIRALNRCLTYAEGYGDLELAREQYALVPADRRIDRCADCSACSVTCRNGIDLDARIHRARALFV